MVGWECPTKPREASGLDPEAVHISMNTINRRSIDVPCSEQQQCSPLVSLAVSTGVLRPVMGLPPRMVRPFDSRQRDCNPNTRGNRNRRRITRREDTETTTACSTTERRTRKPRRRPRHPQRHRRRRPAPTDRDRRWRPPRVAVVVSHSFSTQRVPVSRPNRQPQYGTASVTPLTGHPAPRPVVHRQRPSQGSQVV